MKHIFLQSSLVFPPSTNLKIQLSCLQKVDCTLDLDPQEVISDLRPSTQPGNQDLFNDTHPDTFINVL